MSAGQRRAEMLEAAVAEFALKGLDGTSTDAIARRAGISQPYLFRLFGTKKDLFLAAVDQVFDRVQEEFSRAAEAHPENALEAMGESYKNLLRHREELLLELQAYAACSDPDVAELVRRRYGKLYRLVEQVSGADEDRVREFFAHGMLLTVAAAMDLPSELGTESWVASCLGPLT